MDNANMGIIDNGSKQHYDIPFINDRVSRFLVVHTLHIWLTTQKKNAKTRCS
jgi:hypothetical protein